MRWKPRARSLDRARLFMCTPARQAFDLRASTRRSSRRSRSAIRRPPSRAMEGHLDAVMTELIDFAERNPDAVALPARDTAAA